MIDINTIKIINSLVSNAIPFAFFWYPGENEPEIVIQVTGNVQKYQSITEAKNANGFIFAPFDISNNYPLLVIRPDIYIKGNSNIAKIETVLFQKKQVLNNNTLLADEISKDDYINLINKTIAKIKLNTFEKVVVSRTISASIPTNRTAAEIVFDLKLKSDNAFVYLCSTPESGLWIGASPEVLITRNNTMYNIVSLAATIPLNEKNSYEWSENMQREQAIVSDFIEEQLKEFEITKYVQNGPFTHASANVAHLKTTYEFSTEQLNGKLSDFINAIHLSPAICGAPKEESKNFIIANETHKREYYTGFLGALNMNDDLKLFVNIRCMKILQNKAVLYVGGGITANSIAESEWDETNHKSKTLLAVLAGT